jgi:diguanylate cyclase (GGDEF)-like protein
MIDLDHFKHVNDTHGHLIGDEVLREVARRLCEAVRSYDFVGRYGGEEFLVVAPGYEKSQAMDLAERIRRAFVDRPIRTAAATIPATLSLGVVALGRGQKAEMAQVLSAADEALYKAKSGGRNMAMLGVLRCDEQAQARDGGDAVSQSPQRE